MGGGGGVGGEAGEVQKKYSHKGKLNEKNSCTPIDPKKYSCHTLKKIHPRNLITKKNSCGSKIPHPHHKLSNGPWLLLFVILRYKSDSSFNIKNVAIISYSTAIRRVSKLLFLSYAYLLLIEKRNFPILIGLVCIAKFVLYIYPIL